MIAPTISFMGPVTYHHAKAAPIDSVNQRLFGIDISVYKKKPKDQLQSQSFLILCHFPNNQRWQSFKLPYLNRTLFITGDIIGLYTVNGQRCICISITNLTYTLTAATAQPSSTDLLQTPTSSTSSPPRKRLRRMGEPVTPRITRSTNQTSNVEGKKPIQQSSPEWQIFDDIQDNVSDPDLPTNTLQSHDDIPDNDLIEKLAHTPSSRKKRSTK